MVQSGITTFGSQVAEAQKKGRDDQWQGRWTWTVWCVCIAAPPLTGDWHQQQRNDRKWGEWQASKVPRLDSNTGQFMVGNPSPGTNSSMYSWTQLDRDTLCAHLPIKGWKGPYTWFGKFKHINYKNLMWILGIVLLIILQKFQSKLSVSNWLHLYQYTGLHVCSFKLDFFLLHFESASQHHGWRHWAGVRISSSANIILTI